MTWDGEALEGELPGRQGRLIFAYLVLNRSRAVRRDELVEALWEGVPGGDSLLAPPLSRLRKALGDGRIEGRTELRLSLGEEASIDFEVAGASLEAAQRDLASGNPEAAWTAALEADEILGGGLLPGLEARWIDEHRVIAEEMRLQSLEAVARAGALLGSGEQIRAERAARSAVEASPFRESARAAQIEVMRAQGNVAEALRTYEELRSLLREELGTFPSPELNALHDSLLNASDGPTRPEHPEPPAPEKRAPVRIGAQIDPRIDEIALVGRKAIMECLEDELDRASVGELRIALLAGEGGVGKTRIAAELANSRDELAVLYGRCEPDEIRPFRIWSGLLRTALGQIDADDVKTVVGADGPTLSRLLPELSRRFDLPPPGPPADLEFERQALFGAVLRLIGRMSSERPMLIILDDLQWADRSTLLLLSSLAGDNPPKGVLALGIYRDTELPADSFLLETLVNLQRHRPTYRIEVGSLDTAEVGELVGGRVSEDVAAALHDQTGGNPFYVEQMIRHFEETGDDDPSAVPVEVRDLITQRVARLPRGGSELLGRASLIGRDFDLEILSATTTEPEDRVIELLDAAVKAGLLDESPSVPGRYSFVHALLRSTLDESLGLTRRAQVHRNIGEAIEKRVRSDNEGRLGQLAWHFGQAGPAEADRATLYATRAGEQAEGRLAYDEAVDFYELAIQACRSDEPVDPGLLARLLLKRAEAEWRIGQLQRAGDSFFEAARAARKSGEPHLLAEAAIGTCWGSWEAFDTDQKQQTLLLEEALAALGEEDGPLRACLMAYFAHIIYFSGGSSDRANRLVEEAHAMALRLEDPQTEFTVLTAAQFYTLEPGRRDQRLPSGNRTVEIAENSSDPEDLAEALAWRSVTYITFGMCEEADADQARHALLNRTLPQITVAAKAMRAVRCFIEGNWQEGERVTAEALASNIPSGAVIAMEDALQYMVRALQGRLNEYIGHLEMKAAVAAGWDTWPAWRFGLLLARWQDGQTEKVHRELEEIDILAVESVPQMQILHPVFCGVATLLANEMGDVTLAGKLTEMLPVHEGEWAIFGPAGSTFGPTDMMMGEMLLLLDREREAATSFERALDSCVRMRSRPYLARTQLGLAEALTRMGEDTDRAVELRADGKATAEDLGMAPALRLYRLPAT